MTKNHIKLLLSFIFLLTATITHAQQPTGATPEERGVKLEGLLMKNIDINADQKAALLKVFTTYARNLETYRTDGDNKEMLQAVNNKRNEGVREILNDDVKYDQYLLAIDEMKRDMQERRKNNDGEMRHRGGGGGRHMGGGGMGGNQGY